MIASPGYFRVTKSGIFTRRTVFLPLLFYPLLPLSLPFFLFFKFFPSSLPSFLPSFILSLLSSFPPSSLLVLSLLYSWNLSCLVYW